MKVLWITNVMLPPICKEMGLQVPVVGGWMYSSASSLLKLAPNVQMGVVTVYNGKQLVRKIIDNVTYYLLPLKGNNERYHKCLESIWRQIVVDFKPDLAHLHGTEFAHGLAFQKACPEVKIVVSIQGLVSVIARYYNSSFPIKERIKNLTLRDIIGQFILRTEGVYGFRKRGKIERAIIKRAKYIIGRTEWDKAHVWAINPQSTYYFCNETLRPIFYEKRWAYSRCEPHTIFLSQAEYPVKGLLQLLQAMPFVLREFPDSKIYIAGKDITNVSTFSLWLRQSGYAKYVNKLIQKNSLSDKIIFTGQLNGEQICDMYLRSNLFVCPSTIENSPNSLGEAQLLGMPCIASYVGGIPDMMKDNELWMFRLEEVEMLAKKICEVFELAGQAAINNSLANRRHDSKENTRQLLSIYNDILNK